MLNPNPDRYRQDSPEEELVALLAAAQGDINNIQHGLVNEKQIPRVAELLTEALAILRKMPTHAWDKPRDPLDVCANPMCWCNKPQQ